MIKTGTIRFSKKHQVARERLKPRLFYSGAQWSADEIKRLSAPRADALIITKIPKSGPETHRRWPMWEACFRKANQS